MKKQNVTKTVKDKLFMRVNPFGLMNGAGEPRVFMQPFEIYYFVMCFINHNCPDGYMELLYILSKLYPNLTLKELKFLSQSMHTNGFPDIVFTETWTSAKGKAYLDMFFGCLHIVCETKMNVDAFKYAYDLFNHSNEIQKLKTQTKLDM